MEYFVLSQSSSLSRPLDLKALQTPHVVSENSWYIPNLFVSWDRILSLFLNLVSLELKGKVLFSKRSILHVLKRKKKILVFLPFPKKICLKIWGKTRKWWVGSKVILHSLIQTLVLNYLLTISENQMSIQNRFIPYILLCLVWYSISENNCGDIGISVAKVKI